MASWRRVAGIGSACALLGWSVGRWNWDGAHSGTDSETALLRLPACPLPSSLLVSAAAVVPHTAQFSPSPMPGNAAVAKNKSRVSEIMRFGFPGLDNIRSYGDFVLSYDRRCRVPHWVFEHLTAESVKRAEGVERSHCKFRSDSSLHVFFRATNEDYRNSGFDRGHMAAAGNHGLSQEFMNDTFLLSNMAPQVGAGFNRGKWNDLEQYVRALCKRYANVYVCTGPLYLPQQDQSDGKLKVVYQVVGNNQVAVPTHFFKVVAAESSDGQLDLESYVLPNTAIDESIPVKKFLVPVESVERAAGLLFFDSVQRQRVRSINGK